MFLYSLKQYIRGMARRRLFSFINISGLAFAIAFMILIGQFVYYEFNYNRSIENVDSIYRIADEKNKNYGIDYRIKEEALGSIPGIKSATMLLPLNLDVNYEDEVFPGRKIMIVDEDFFEFFNLHFIAGNSSSALKTIESVVLTRTAAENIFGTIDIIGKSILLNHEEGMIVTGVIEDIPDDYSFNSEMFASILNTPQHRLGYRMSCEWYDGEDDSHCQYPDNIFVRLDDKADIKAIEKQISAFGKINKYRYAETVKLLPLKTNYLNTAYYDTDLKHGNISLIKILSVIGIIVLFLAIVNFVNLTTAAYRYRITELGIKKCLGVGRLNLVKQLLLESLFTCSLASVCGIILALLFTPYFNQFIDKRIELQLFIDPVFFLLFISFIIFLSVITGIIPALVLSRITPLQIFKLNSYIKGSGKTYRGVFTAVQFSITIVLIFSLFVISKQIEYAKHKNHGFNTEQLMYLSTHYTLQDRLPAIAGRLAQFHTVKDITLTQYIPGKIYMSCDGHQAICIDSTSLKTFGFKIIKGRNLQPSDVNNACLINYASYKKFDEEDLTKLKVNGSQVVGVVSDFDYASVHEATGPLVLLYNDNWGKNYITIKIAGSIPETIDYIKNIWQDVCPDYPLEYGFYDEQFASMYSSEENLALLVSIFSILAIAISCMGIFGLSVFQAGLRVKEIGIRKVLGATTSEITLILTKSFSLWVLFANVIALPVAYYLMQSWLQDFAYKIHITWWMFVLAGGIALIIALATVSFNAVKAASANPVESLKYE